jgi:hypothetical protein
MSARLALLVGAALVCGGCKVTSDIGKECVLVRKATAEEQAKENNPAPSRYIMESQITKGQDFISFGTVECEDLVCVRDANYVPTVDEADKDKPPSEIAAKGYCSKPCVQDDTALTDACAVTDTGVQAEVKERMTCRPLLLDQLALDALRTSDKPEDRATYRSLFGDNTSPAFCAAAKPTTTP